MPNILSFEAPSTENRSFFDICLKAGHEAENHVATLLTGVAQDVHFEVKWDRRASQTNNVYIEFQQRTPGNPEWRPSGIGITKAEFFVLVFDGGMTVMAPTADLKTALKALSKQGKVRRLKCSDGPGKQTEGCVVNADTLMAAVRELGKRKPLSNLDAA